MAVGYASIFEPLIYAHTREHIQVCSVDKPNKSHPCFYWGMSFAFCHNTGKDSQVKRMTRGCMWSIHMAAHKWPRLAGISKVFITQFSRAMVIKKHWQCHTALTNKRAIVVWKAHINIASYCSEHVHANWVVLRGDLNKCDVLLSQDKVSLQLIWERNRV